MPARPFPQPVERGRRPRAHRFMPQMPHDVLRERRRRGVAPPGFLLQRLHHDPVEVTFEQPDRSGKVRAQSRLRARRGETGHARARLRRHFLTDAPLEFRQRRGLELRGIQRRHAGEQFVEQHAQRVNIRARVHLRPAQPRLLRTHIRRRAHELAQSRVQRRPGVHAAHGLGDSKINDHRPRLTVGFTDEDVRRLQIPVNDPARMGVLHRTADLAEKRQPFARRHFAQQAKLG